MRDLYPLTELSGARGGSVRDNHCYSTELPGSPERSMLDLHTLTEPSATQGGSVRDCYSHQVLLSSRELDERLEHSY